MLYDEVYYIIPEYIIELSTDEKACTLLNSDINLKSHTLGNNNDKKITNSCTMLSAVLCTEDSILHNSAIYGR